MNSFRGFIAVEIPINNMIKNVHNEIAKLPANIKLVEPENIHITLKFLGETKEEHIDLIHQFMQSAVKDIDPFSIQLKGMGVFPNQNYIKIIWIRIENTESLSLISSILNTKLASIGYKKEKRGFRAHLTIGRVKNSKGKDQLINLINQYQHVLFDEIQVDRIFLKKSILTPQGPIYETIKTVTIH
jgi:2'-5' RNA ligase